MFTSNINCRVIFYLLRPIGDEYFYISQTTTGGGGGGEYVPFCNLHTVICMYAKNYAGLGTAKNYVIIIGR